MTNKVSNMKRKTNRHAIYWEPVKRYGISEDGSFNIRKHSEVRQSNRAREYVKGAKVHTIAHLKRKF